MQGGRGAERVRDPGRPLTAGFSRSEYNAFWKCVQAGVTYLFVQLCKVRDSGTPGLHVSSLQAFQISGTRLCLCHLP